MNFNWFIDPIENHYADFTGRATREQYWMFVLFQIVFTIGVGIIAGLVEKGALSLIVVLGLIIPSIAIAARRLHDIGKSGWWQLISFIPYIGVIVLIVWLASKGNAEANEYGNAPGASGQTAATPVPNPVSTPTPTPTPIPTPTPVPTPIPPVPISAETDVPKRDTEA